ncbi:hypothetical protein MTO96_039551, partial [Rhipicephalus appendiculatus]
TFRSVETLLFVAADNSCGIFKIESLTDWNAMRYDLRVKNSFITRRPRISCRNYYNRVIGRQPSFTVYAAQCRWVF